MPQLGKPMIRPHRRHRLARQKIADRTNELLDHIVWIATTQVQQAKIQSKEYLDRTIPERERSSYREWNNELGADTRFKVMAHRSPLALR